MRWDGINTSKNARSIPDQETPDARNGLIGKGKWQTRPGMVKIDSFAAGAPIMEVGYFKSDDCFSGFDLVVIGERLSKCPLGFVQELSDLPQSTNVRGFWKLEETSGTLVDQSINNADLDIIDGIVYGQEGKVGKCLLLDNIADHATGPGTNLLDFENESFSLAIWIKPTFEGQEGMLLSYPWSAIFIRGYALGLSAGKIAFSVANDASSIISTIIGNTVLSANTWSLVIATYKYVSNGTSELRVYLNTTLDATPKTNGVAVSKVGPGTRFYLGNGAHSLGFSHNAVLGYYDEGVAWKNVALSQADVTDLYSIPRG